VKDEEKLIFLTERKITCAIIVLTKPEEIKTMINAKGK